MENYMYHLDTPQLHILIRIAPCMLSKQALCNARPGLSHLSYSCDNNRHTVCRHDVAACVWW